MDSAVEENKEANSEAESVTESKAESDEKKEDDKDKKDSENVTIEDDDSNPDYHVSITYDSKKVTNIPEGATVSVTSYSDSDKQYKEAKEKVLAAKKAEDENFDEDSLGMKALDISILDKDGKEIEPNGTVSVKLELKKMPEGVDEGTKLEIGHILGTSNNVVATAKKAPAWNLDEEDEENTSSARSESAAETKKANSVETVKEDVKAESGVSAEFDVDSFSTFTITYNNNRFTKIYVVDANGNSIGSDNFTAVNSRQTSINELSNLANPSSATTSYKFVEARVGSDFSRAANTILDSTNGYIYYYDDNYGWCYSVGNNQVRPFGNQNNLYLVYQRTDGNVTLSFDVNGGSGTVDSITGRCGTTVQLPSYTGTRAGYTFLGWTTDTCQYRYDTSLPGTTYHRIYEAGTDFIMPENDTTLYAVWTPITPNRPSSFFIRLDGTIPYEPDNYSQSAYTAGITIPNNLKTLQWIVDNDTTKPIANEGKGNYVVNDVTNDLYKMPSNAQIVEVLSTSAAKSATGLTVKEQGGEIVVTGITVDSPYQDKVKIGDKLYVLWYVQKLQNMSGASKNDDDTKGIWHIDGTLQVKNLIGVSYDGNPPAGAGTATNVPLGYQETSGTDIKVGASGSKNGSQMTPVLPGYTFLGWTKNTRENDGTLYLNSQDYTLKETTTFYAQWSKGNNSLTVHKTDEDGNTLQGARFTLEEKNDSGKWSQVTQGTSNDNGVWTFNNVSSQTVYRMTETYAPNGYETRNAFCFKVTTDGSNNILNLYVTDENGNILSKNAKPDWVDVEYTPTSTSGGAAQLNITIKDEQIKRKVIFKKTAADGETALGGAKFSLTDANSKTVDNVLTERSDSNGIFSTANATLTYGTYILTETAAPEGYKKNDPITITLNDPSGDAAKKDRVYNVNTGMTFTGDDARNVSVSMQRTSSNDNNIATTTYTYTVTVKDDPYKDLTIRKVAHTDAGDYRNKNTPLTGATFTLSRRNAAGAFEQVTDIDGINENGQFTITQDTGIELNRLPAGVYSLKEDTPPSGYIVLANDIYFTIGKNGTIDFSDKNGNPLTTEDQKPDAKFVSSEGGAGNAAKTTLYVANTAGKALPTTGGHGTLPYTVGGLLVVIAAGVFYIIFKKRSYID